MSYFKIRSSHKTHRAHQQTQNYLSNSISLQKSNQPIDLIQIQKSFDLLLHNENIHTSAEEEQHPIINPNDNPLLLKFKESIKGSENKIERERVNIITKISQSLLHDHQRQIQIIKGSITLSQQQLKNLYEKSHELYLKMQQVRKQNPEKHKIKLALKQFNKKHEELKQLEKVKETEVKRLHQSYSDQNDIQLHFLLALLKQGCYQQNGLKWILLKFVQLDFKPKYQHFPSILDAISRKCLLKEYNNLKREHEIKHLHIERLRNKKVKSNGELFSERKNGKLKQVYSDTRQYIENWVRDSKWKKRQSFGQMHFFVNDKKMERWENEQKRRINNLYEGEQKRKIKKLIFGIKLDSVF